VLFNNFVQVCDKEGFFRLPGSRLSQAGLGGDGMYKRSAVKARVSLLLLYRKSRRNNSGRIIYIHEPRMFFVRISLFQFPRLSSGDAQSNKMEAEIETNDVTAFKKKYNVEIEMETSVKRNSFQKDRRTSFDLF
jgi:hypothetical protein